MLNCLLTEKEGLKIPFNPLFSDKYLEYRQQPFIVRKKQFKAEIERIYDSNIEYKDYYIDGLINYSVLISSKCYLYVVNKKSYYVSEKQKFFKFLKKHKIPFNVYSDSYSLLMEVMGDILKMDIDEICVNAISSINVKEKEVIVEFLKDLSTALRVVEGDPESEIEKAEKILGISLTAKQKEQVSAKYDKPFTYDEEKTRTMNSYANVLDTVLEGLKSAK